ASIGDDHLDGYLATRKLIDHGHTRIGLIMGPEYATTAVQRRAGYRAALTDDLSIIGYNDIPVVSRLPVPLTTIREPFNHIARGAIDLLLDETPNDSGEIRTIVATPTLIPRKSTAAPRTR